MTPQQFIAKWRPANLTERSAAQQHFLDLCELLNQPKPVEADPEGAWYTFERGVHKVGGGEGWADVWKRGHFGWEYKGQRKDLKAAYNQLLQYREDLENPPLLVVCDLDRFEVHTNFTGTAKKVYAFDLEGLTEPANLSILLNVFTAPEKLRPNVSTRAVTEQVAKLFAELAKSLRLRGVPAKDAAHFLMKLMFCLFAEDIELLPNNVFTRSLESARKTPSRFQGLMTELFTAMAHGGNFGADEILYFNGGLFADAAVIELRPEEIEVVCKVAAFDWSAVETSIFGTLFERSFDPDKEELIGAHFTSREDIETLLRPVMLAPLRREWDDVRRQCEALWPVIQAAARRETKSTAKRKASKPRAKFDRLIHDFVERLSHVTVLDPACGSGNFLYVALHLLLDLEKEVITFAASHGVTQLPHVRPTQLLGIEINPYAQELAQVVIWIGYLQWMRDNGFSPPRNPVLEPIESIRRMDAILDLTNPAAPLEPEWPPAEFIVGNPPFLGGKLLRTNLGDEYVNAMFKMWNGRVPREADLCCYWFVKSREMIDRGKVKRAGLIATQGIRGGANREVLKAIKKSGDIFFAISDRDWILDGANVHVSIVGFDDGSEPTRFLDGNSVPQVNANLTGGTADLVQARPQTENLKVAFMADTKGGAFDVPSEVAHAWLRLPNPGGRPNSDVLRPWVNGMDLTRRSREMWIIDFGCEMTLDQAAGYEKPFEYVRENVKPDRDQNKRASYRERWWIHVEPRPAMRARLSPLTSFVATPNVTKHRLFVKVESAILADHQLIAFGRDDDFFFGVLHSRVHEVWARSLGTQVRERESGFRYTPTTCFETFAFPSATEAQREAIGAAAGELDRLRNNWLNPPEWTRTETLEFPGSTTGPWARYVDPAVGQPFQADPNAPHNVDRATGQPGKADLRIGTVRYPRLVPRDAACAEQLQKRTLTNLYNQRPTWLDLAHRKLDAAVFAAYRWSPTLSDDELLAALLRLNLERAGST